MRRTPASILAFYSRYRRGDRGLPGEVLPEGRASWRKLRPVKRAIGRLRRATNPDNFNEDRTVKIGA